MTTILQQLLGHQNNAICSFDCTNCISHKNEKVFQLIRIKLSGGRYVSVALGR